MSRSRDPLPDDIQKLVELCRAGRLFAVQQWIHDGKRFLMPDGNFTTSPFRAALKTGFHSLIEVFLQAGIAQADLDRGLGEAVSARRLDLIELFAAHGANLRTITIDRLIAAREPTIFRWFLSRDLDLETGYPIARALQDRHREFLGIYMDVRDRILSARAQAAMALRVHAREGNMKWVSLLLWAGADARLPVPDLRFKHDTEMFGSAMEDAVIYSRTEVVRKFGLRPGSGDPTQLLAKCWMCEDLELIRFLLHAGANPNAGLGDNNPMCALMGNLRRTLHPVGPFRRPHETAFRCLELAGEHGGRWSPHDSYELRDLRMILGKLGAYLATECLRRLITANVFGEGVVRELMKTPRMKKILDQDAPGSKIIRESAGYRKRPRR